MFSIRSIAPRYVKNCVSVEKSYEKLHKKEKKTLSFHFTMCIQIIVSAHYKHYFRSNHLKPHSYDLHHKKHIFSLS